MEKYQFKPYTGSSHSWAIRHCLPFSSESRVLDIGCGSGMIGNVLKEYGFSNLFAVEIDPAAREQSMAIYSRVEASIEAFRGQRFDLILLLDILEHLPEPFVYFKDVLSFLNEGGSAIISIPNVAHWSVRFPLLFGFFSYTERGILDRTHLQFFTRRRFKSLLACESSVKTVELSSSIEPLELILPRYIWDTQIFNLLSKVRLQAAKLLPGLLAYQHLAVLSK